MRWPHWHHDPNWQLVGVWRLYQCRCGHRRTERAYVGIISPIPDGWPDTFDRHGQHTMSSGWVAPPQGGWPPPRTMLLTPPKGR